MKSKQYPYEVYVLRKRVNLSSESGQLYSGEAVNRIRTGRQMLKNKAQKESTLYRERQKDTQSQMNHKSQITVSLLTKNLMNFLLYIYNIYIIYI